MTNDASIQKYIIVYLLFSLAGWIYDHLIFNMGEQDNQDPLLKKMSRANIPLCSIYGLAGVILLFIHYNMTTIPFILKVLLASIVINSIECLMGQLSYRINGFASWNYQEYLVPACSGYISLTTAIWWTFLIAIIFIVFDEMDI